jgi:hypothetical protein
MAEGFGQAGLGHGWGKGLSQTGVFDPRDLRILQAAAITTVEDFLAAAVATPQPIANLLGTKNLAALQADLAQTDDYAAVMATANELLETDLEFGALAPDDVEVSEEVAEALFFATLDQLGPPEEAPEYPDALERVDCLPCMGPVRNQNERGTCVAHAVVAVLECLEGRKTGTLLDLSEQFLYWNCKQSDGKPTAPGTLISVAIDCAIRDGVCLESDWPYMSTPIAGNEGQGPPPGAALAGASLHQARTSVPLARRSSADIRQQLDSGIPVAISIPVFAKWLNPSGKIAMPILTASLLGGHAMCAVGYQPDLTAPGGGFFIVRNSWGTTWAPQSPVAAGYGALPYAYVDSYGWESETMVV